MSDTAAHLSAAQRTLSALQKARAQLEAVEQRQHEPIAIIGMGCRFPGADNPDAFWQLLREGCDAVREIPPDRWDVEAYFAPHPDTPGKMYVRHAALLDAVDQFDPQFFGISPREASSMDPQQRLLLEVTWEALEHAGQAPTQLVGSRTGLFIGMGQNDYAQLQLHAGDPQRIDAYDGTGNFLAFATGRLSFVLGLQGPNMAIDTACSASLTAVHLAVMSLRAGECDLALAGGVHLVLAPDVTLFLSRVQALAPDGRCKTFDALADGYGRGEGCGVVVLKRLRDALAHGDQVLALIRGSAINHNGPSSGFTVPNALAQEALIRQALTNARVAAHEIAYVEAHGTGTRLGDPLEVRAIAAALGERQTPLLIGSVKTNIGHLEAAAGIAGLIKVVLAFQHGEIPAHLHLHEPNPHLNWTALPVLVPTRATPWPAGKRLAGVSSFGMSGSNAHVVLEAAPPAAGAWSSETIAPDRPLHLLTLSAHTADALQQLAERYDNALRVHEQRRFTDICFTAHTGRAHFPHRLSVVAAAAAEARAQLAAFRAGQQTPGVMRGHAAGVATPKVAFLFTGQGSQYLNMGRQLYTTQPTFARTLDRCDAILRPYLDQPLLAVLYPDLYQVHTAPAQQSAALLQQTAYTQPALFALEYALAELWQSWGIVPHIVMGHSVGEYVAACVAGVFSLEDGLQLIARRGQLMQALPQPGAMVAVFASEERVTTVLAAYGQEVSIAAINGPQHVVISGARHAIDQVVTSLTMAGIRTTALQVAQAFHSPLMEPMLADFARVAHAVAYATPRLRMVSNVTGTLAPDEMLASAAYWLQHVRQPVRFVAGMATLHQLGYEVFVEIGPRPILVELSRSCVPPATGLWLASLHQDGEDWQHLLASVGQLYVHGIEIDWAGFERDYSGPGTPGRNYLALPTYPFQRQRYWVPPPVRGRGPAPAQGGHPLLGQRLHLPFASEARFEAQYSPDFPSYCEDHQLYGQVVVPGACHLALALSGGREAFAAEACVVEDVVFSQALVLARHRTRSVQTIFTPTEQHAASFQVVSLAEGQAATHDAAWTLHATGNMRYRPSGESPGVPVEALKSRCIPYRSGAAFYADFWQAGYHLGPSFRWLEHIWRGASETLCQMATPLLPDDVALYPLHPTLIDACFQALFADKDELWRDRIFVPWAIDRLHFYGVPTPGSQLWAHAEVQIQDLRRVRGDIRLFEDSGRLIADIRGLETRSANREALLRGVQQDLRDWMYEEVWRPQPLAPAATAVPAEDVEGWLIFTDRGGIGTRVAALLIARGERGVRVVASPGALPGPTVPDALPVLEPAAVRQVLYDGRLPLKGILHLWSLDMPDHDLTPELQHLSYGSVLPLLQDVSRTRNASRLWLVTRGARPARPGQPLQVFQAPLWGLGKVIAVEHPDLHCVCIDLDPEQPDPATLSQMLFQELWAPAREEQVAFRQGERYVARLVQAPRTTTSRPILRAEGSYLITGGLGALGLRVAQFLGAQGARRLVLTGRRGATSQAAHDTVKQLEQAGLHVRIITADVAQRAEVVRVLAVCQSLAPLRGIIHAAGVVDDGMLLQQSVARFNQVMAPKVQGTWHLHALTQEMPLDFFICFSSMATVLGALGQGNYAAANSFMDALAHHRRALGLPALSINWGPWADVGMAAQLDHHHQQRLADRGLESLTPEQGLQALAHLLGAGPQVAVQPLHWSKLLQQYRQPPAYLEDFYRELHPRQATPVPVRQHLEALPTHRRYAALVDHIGATVARVLRLPEPPGQHLGFFDIGMDSLTALELRNLLQSSLDCPLPATVAFNYPTVQTLVHYVATEILVLSDTSEPARPAPQAQGTRTVNEDLAATLDAFSDEELMGLLAEKLSELALPPGPPDN